MAQERTRKIAIAGALSAIACLLGLTRLGFIPWFSGASLTIMHVPVIIGAVLEGPIVGAVVGLIFGIFSMIQAAVAPTGPSDTIFTNPLVAVLPRLLIGPLAWLAWKGLQRWQVVGLLAAGVIGSLTNTVFVLGMIGLFGYLPWEVIGTIAIANGPAELVVSALLTLLVIAAWWRIRIGKRQGADL